LVDGLCDDSSLAAGCLSCGDGIPPDWYVYQGLRVISHSATRRNRCRFEAGGRHLFASLNLTAGSYTVTNKVTTLFDNTARSGSR